MTAVEALAAALRERFGEQRIGRQVPLAPLTTFRVGGPAEVLFEPRSEAEIVAALQLAARHGVEVAMLGGGSNVLVADAGVRGLVLRPRGGVVAEEGPGRVRAGAAATVNGVVRWLIGRGLAGLEAWAGTPGTIGGGIYGNAHWAGRLLSEHVVELRLACRAGDVLDVPVEAMAFGYDRSRLQQTHEVLLSALFRVSRGDPETLRATARASLAYRKRTQPLHAPSAGCVFQNPGPEDRVPPGVPASAGALVDRAGLKGARIGGAAVSTTHANFIVNTGTATARDVRRLIEQCRERVLERAGVALRDEIVYLGAFDEPDAHVR